MSLRAVAMAVGTLACLAPIFTAPGMLSANVMQAASFAELQPWSFDSIVTAAYVVTTTLLPAVCVISIARGWLAFWRGPKALALNRLLFWPLAFTFGSAALYVAQYAAARL